MASTFATPAIIAAIRSLLVANAGLASALSVVSSSLGGGPAIYAEDAVPQGAAFPYLTIGAPTEIPWNTMGAESDLKWGSDVTFQVKAFSTAGGYDQVYSLIGLAKPLLDGKSLTVTGYGSAFVEFDSAAPSFSENVGGLIVRQLPAIFRVKAHQL